jgi:cytochrome c
MIRTAIAVAALSLVVAPAVAQPAPAAAGPDGKQIFDLQCGFCHNDDTMGPSLTGVHERKIAAGGFEYSDSLKAKKEEAWTDANLDAFLKAPNEFAPGTKMQMAVTDDANRAAVIAYLKTLK